jgi:hypothetical protein
MTPPLIYPSAAAQWKHGKQYFKLNLNVLDLRTNKKTPEGCFIKNVGVIHELPLHFLFFI